MVYHTRIDDLIINYSRTTPFIFFLQLDLDAGLRAQIRRGLPTDKKTPLNPFKSSDFSGILTPSDEVQFWQDLKASAGSQEAQAMNLTAKQQHMAGEFARILGPLASDFSDISRKTFAQLLDLMDSIMSVSDEVFRCGNDPEALYGQKRLSHFLLTVGSAIGRAVQARLATYNIWGGAGSTTGNATGTQQFNLVAKYVREGQRVCERWNE